MTDTPKPDANGIYEESGFRLPLPRNDSGDPELQKFFDNIDKITKDPARGKAGAGVGLRGPGGIVMYSPEYSKLATAESMYLRFHSGLEPHIRELACIVAAREMDQQFEYTAHAGMALREGLSQEAIDVVAYRKPVDGLPEKEAVVITLGRQAITEHKVPRETFDAAIRIFGPRHLVNLLGLMGGYVSTALFLHTFDMQLPPEWKPTMPEL